MVRAFTAIQFPPKIKQKVARAIEPLKQQLVGNPVRWVDPALYHLTLKFLGDIEEERLEAIEQALAEVVSELRPFALRIGEFGVFPSRRKPRVLWVGLQDRSDSLLSLWRALEAEFITLGFKKDRRSFHPHITVGRVRRQDSKQDLRQLEVLLEDFSLPHLAEVTTHEIQLVKSELTPQGPIYTTITSLLLGEPK